MCYLGAVNFLGHAYFSFNNPEVLVGNMISDFVKGRAQYDFPESIQKGIRLHRSIDAFTDDHPATRAAREVFKAHYRLYSAPLVDVVYDHLLANDNNCFTKEMLLTFSNHTYSTLENFRHLLPQRFAMAFEYMKRDNWLYGYHTEAGIFRSLRGLMHRASINDDGTMACTILSSEKQHLQQNYNEFIKDVKIFAKARYEELTQ
jgi:acyl carrier protein phosphodiesterase